MVGVIYYSYFLILGFLYSKYLFQKNIYFHIWIGGIIGNLLLMVGIILPSFFFGFTLISHIIWIILVSIPFVILWKKRGFPSLIEKKKYNKKDEMTKKIFIFTILPIFLLIAILLTNHILVPKENGTVAVGQSTYGDLNMHIGFITSIKEQQKFPPNYVFLSKTKLNYPFFVNMLSSSLYLLGSSLRLSILLPSYIICLLLVMGFYYLAHIITKNKKVSILATIFFFLGGGFGFFYFLDGSRENISYFTKIFTDFYHTPTNYNEVNIRWANPICDMIIPQRTTMAGWCMIMPCLYFLIEGCKTNNKKDFILLGILASTMPMIHTHSFLALGIISIGMFFTNFIPSKEKKKVFKNWFLYGIIVLLLAFPQLFLWTFQQTKDNNFFTRFRFNWVNTKDPYLWFYLKNWGMVALFFIPSFINANKTNKKIIISSILLMIVGELFLFQPNEYDNNKLLFISYMIFLINCCDYLYYIYQKLKGVPGRFYLVVVTIILFLLSGVLTIIREYKSEGEYETFNSDMIKMSNYIKKNTSKDSIFLTSTTHINPVATLAGRNIYVGSSLYVYFHGLGKEYQKRSNEVEKIYNSNIEELREFCKKNHIDYIYIGTYEKGSLEINWDSINQLEKVVFFNEESLYKIN